VIDLFECNQLPRCSILFDDRLGLFFVFVAHEAQEMLSVHGSAAIKGMHGAGSADTGR